jgi:hypothetical protein
MSTNKRVLFTYLNCLAFEFLLNPTLLKHVNVTVLGAQIRLN